jgi:hypothetical protein
MGAGLQAACAVLLLVACNGSRAPVVRPGGGAEHLDSTVHVVPGEQMTYVIRWYNVDVARVRVGIGYPGFIGEQPAIVIKSVTEGYGLSELLIDDAYWSLRTELDTARGLPLRASEVISWNDGRPHREEQDRRWRAGQRTHNLHSGVAMMRAWRPSPGTEASEHVNIVANFGVDLKMAGRQYLPAHEIHAYRIDCVAHLGIDVPFSVWFSDDERRVLLRARAYSKFGTFTADLRSWRRVRPSASQPAQGAAPARP